MTKSELRKLYLAKQKSFSPFDRKQKSEQIADNFFQMFDLNNIRFLHCFVAIERFNEIDTLLIFKRLWQDFPPIQTLVPRVNFQIGEIENLKFTAETKLKENVWQIYEPTASEIIETDKIDAVLVPLLCFDERGFRVGYGKGFYDRFLKNCREDCLKIGLSYFAPIAEIADVQIFDIQLDYCITPQKVWTFSVKANKNRLY
ncbi:MAG: 5-formyltetrahydrofolate cyclo-ligase [Pyrinomonadaceae bacterium]